MLFCKNAGAKVRFFICKPMPYSFFSSIFNIHCCLRHAFLCTFPLKKKPFSLSNRCIIGKFYVSLHPQHRKYHHHAQAIQLFENVMGNHPAPYWQSKSAHGTTPRLWRRIAACDLLFYESDTIQLAHPTVCHCYPSRHRGLRERWKAEELILILTPTVYMA